MHIALDATVDGPHIHALFDTLFEILDKAKKITGIRLKERSKEGWYFTRPADKQSLSTDSSL